MALLPEPISPDEERPTPPEAKPSQPPISPPLKKPPAPGGEQPQKSIPTKKPWKKIISFVFLILIFATILFSLIAVIIKKEGGEAPAKATEGKFIVVNFDHYNPNPLLPLPGVTSEGEREQLLKEERAYADNLIQSIYNDLKAKKITFEEALTKVQEDEKVGFKSKYSTSLQSGLFTTTDYIEKRGLLNFETVRQKVDSLVPGQFSKPFIQQVNVARCDETEAGCQPNYVDARWIIVKVDR